MTLADDFEQACLQAVHECRSLGYPPNAWAAMIRRYGAVDAAKRLLPTPDAQEGFNRLVGMGRMDLTVEFAVLDPHWRILFSDIDREAAHWRLGQAMRGRLFNPPPRF